MIGAILGILRSIDLRYAERPFSDVPEERFEFVLKIAQRALANHDVSTILEVGCAAGDFARWLVECFPKAAVTGLDLHPVLVTTARERVPSALFRVGDLEQRESLPDSRFDVVFMLTVHSHFDSCGEWLDNLLSLLRRDGRLFMFGIFNASDVDVMVRARYANGEGEWLPGWSILSRKTMQSALAARGWRGRFFDFEPSEPWARRTDPLAAWTEGAAIGKAQIRNGLCQLLEFSLLEVEAMSY